MKTPIANLAKDKDNSKRYTMANIYMKNIQF